MIRCEAVKVLLSPFMDGALEGAEREQVGAHVALCSDCGRALDSLRNMSRLLKSLAQAPLPTGFQERLERKRHAPSFQFSRGPQLGLAFAAAGVMLIVVANRRQQAAIETASAPLATATGKTLDGLTPAGKDGPVELSAPAPMRSRPVEQGGQPMGAAKSYSNEELQSNLRAQTQREGIVPAGPESDEDQNEPFMGRHPNDVASTREQAEESIRQIQEMRHEVERGSGKKKEVPIAGNMAPVLSKAAPSIGQAIEPAEAAPKPASPEKPVWDNGMAGSYSGGLEGTRTILDDKAWDEVWVRVSKDSRPPVDFSKREIVAVFLGPRPSGGYAARILWVGDEGPAFVVRWQEIAPTPGTAAPDGATSPFALKVITRTDLPVRYEKVP